MSDTKRTWNDGLGESVRPWDRSEAELLAEAGIFTLRKIRSSSQGDADKAGEFVYIEAPDWVNVVALTPDRRIVLVEQFRHGVAEVTLEIPGGTVDPGEEPLAAGLRELREETGYEGENGRFIGAVTPNPAILNNRCFTLLVENAERTSEQSLEGTEEIAVHLVPLEQIPDLVRDGRIDHALVLSAFLYLHLLGKL